ncbi:hypothetical protein GCM10027568_19330 [Humibacter soli]
MRPPSALAIAVELMKIADAVATACGSRRWARMMPSAANTPQTPPIRICPANMPAPLEVSAKHRFAATPKAAPTTMSGRIPMRLPTITLSGMRSSSMRGWMPITAPLTTAGR